MSQHNQYDTGVKIRHECEPINWLAFVVEPVQVGLKIEYYRFLKCAGYAPGCVFVFMSEKVEHEDHRGKNVIQFLTLISEIISE